MMDKAALAGMLRDVLTLAVFSGGAVGLLGWLKAKTRKRPIPNEADDGWPMDEVDEFEQDKEFNDDGEVT